MIKCQDSHIYMKTEWLQTKWDLALFGLFGKGKDGDKRYNWNWSK